MIQGSILRLRPSLRGAALGSLRSAGGVPISDLQRSRNIGASINVVL